MARPAGNRFERIFLVAFWLFCCWVLWWPGMGALSIGGGRWEKDYGFVGYYVVVNDHGNESGRVSQAGMAETFALTAMLSALCVWGWRRSAKADK